MCLTKVWILFGLDMPWILIFNSSTSWNIICIYWHSLLWDFPFQSLDFFWISEISTGAGQQIECGQTELIFLSAKRLYTLVHTNSDIRQFYNAIVL